MRAFIPCLVGSENIYSMIQRFSRNLFIIIEFYLIRRSSTRLRGGCMDDSSVSPDSFLGFFEKQF